MDRQMSIINTREDFKKIIISLIGKPCCRVKVGAYKSLSMGFGLKIYHNDPKLNCDYYVSVL